MLNINFPASSSNELEILASNYGAEFGFTVTLFMNDGKEWTFHNLHEVHLNYKPGSSALESNYHGGGMTFFNSRVSRISICASNMYYNNLDYVA